MSDNIEFNKQKGTHSFVSHKEIAWHGLGQVVDKAMTSSEAIKLANLDYEVRKDRVAVIFPKELEYNVTAKYIPGAYATYRTDTKRPFGIVSDRYEIVQNRDAFGFIDSIIGKDKAVFETAGALGNGETVFITAKLPYYIRINGHDTIENYLVISNGHDGKTSLNIFLTPIRVVCANTLAFGLENNKFKLNLRHTSGINDRIDDARKLLTISKTITEEQELIFKQLAKTQIDDREAKEYFNHVFLTPSELMDLANNKIKLEESGIISARKKNMVKTVNEYYHTGVGQSDIIGTVFGVFNAVNGYLSNIKKYRNDSARMESLVLGGSDYRLNNKALELAKDLA